MQAQPPADVQAPAGGPTTPAGPGLASMPMSMPQPQRMPSAPPPPLSAPVDPTSPDTDPAHIRQARDPADIKNIFERRGALLALAVEEQGKRLADAMAQPPTNAVKLSNAQIVDFWRSSPVAADEATANQRFWEVHDQTLAETGDPAKAEQTALEQVFPHRAAMVGRGVASIEHQVEQANAIRKLVDGSVAPARTSTARVLHAYNREVTG